jgi:hypothetical protein
MLHNIKDKCSHYLQASVDEERVCVVLQTAHDFHLDDLRTNALKFILSIGEPCLQSTGWLHLLADFDADIWLCSILVFSHK